MIEKGERNINMREKGERAGGETNREILQVIKNIQNTTSRSKKIELILSYPIVL